MRLCLENEAYTKYKFADLADMDITVNGEQWTVTDVTEEANRATVCAVSTTWKLNDDTPSHTHENMTYVAEKAATCIEKGNKASRSI